METQNNLELENSLKEFEQKSSAEQAQTSSEPAIDPGLPTMVRWVMKLSGGAVKTQRSAEYILLVIAIIIFSISLYFFFGNL